MKTEVNIHRIAYTEKSTTGLYIVDGEQWPCVSLEDRIRPPGVKVYGQTCIPAGKYMLAKRESPKFKREVIWVKYVPGFDYVYIHSLNKASETDGCLGIAAKRINWDWILGDAFSWERKLFNYIESRGWSDAWLTVTNGPGHERFTRAAA
jgi:hypothetical protein